VLELFDIILILQFISLKIFQNNNNNNNLFNMNEIYKSIFNYYYYLN
jgi:hypothetical protein